MVLIHPHLIVIEKNDKILTKDTTKWTFSEVLSSGMFWALTRYTKTTKDKQNTIKLLHSAWFNDTWLNCMDPL